MTDNPYAPPGSPVDLPPSPVDLTLHEPRAVPPGHGIKWVAEGFDHFRSAVGPWFLICLVGFAVTLAIGLVPLANLANSLITYVWIAGLILGCKAQDDGDGITVSHLFAGFRNHFGELVLLSVIVSVLSFAVMFAAMSSVFATLMSASLGNEEALQELTTMMTDDLLGSFLMPMLIGMLFVIPIIMMAWFAPALIVLNNVGVIQAMRMSFIGCAKNTLPFLLYGIVFLVLFVLAMIPLMLGLLVVTPMFFGSIYRSYKDIYIAP